MASNGLSLQPTELCICSDADLLDAKQIVFYIYLLRIID